MEGTTAIGPAQAFLVAMGEQMAAVRIWLKSARWQEAMALRPRRHRTYQRQAA